jgi:hypothetical protein
MHAAASGPMYASAELLHAIERAMKILSDHD